MIIIHKLSLVNTVMGGQAFFSVILHFLRSITEKRSAAAETGVAFDAKGE